MATSSTGGSRALARAMLHAYVLHSHDWSESSLILDVFTRERGRIIAAAKGAKRPYSQLRSVLLPFQRLNVSFGTRTPDETEVWLLKHAEWGGGSAWPGGAAMLPAYYLNELLMRFLVRLEPMPILFDVYAHTLPVLTEPAAVPAALRAFELILLRVLGHLPSLAAESASGELVRAERPYALWPDLGLQPWEEGADSGSSPQCLPGHALLAIEQALSAIMADTSRLCRVDDLHDLMHACVPVLNELKIGMRALIHYHLGSHTLRTRQWMIELQQLDQA
jgi:DNA repair protein RecO (recombination protein O)